MKPSPFAALMLLGACATEPPFEPTAAYFADFYKPEFIAPRPEVIATQGLNLPLRAGDQLLANCAEFFSDELPEMEAKDRAAFDASIACVYPPAGESMLSGQHYYRALAERGFEDDSGTYVQSGIRILCNRTHSVSIAFKGKFIPSSILDENGNVIEIEGGGDIAHDTLMVSVSDRPCDRYKEEAILAEVRAETPAPDGYANFPQPLFVEPSPEKISWGAFEIQLRPGDRLVSHCSQYYTAEVSSTLSANPTPIEYAHRNRLIRCIYVPQDGIVAASAYYAEQLRQKGLTGSPSRAAPKPDEEYPPLRAGQYEWSGRTFFCDDRRSVGMVAMAHHGPMVLLDALTGEFWSTIDQTGGRRARLDQADYPHKILALNLSDLPCEW